MIELFCLAFTLEVLVLALLVAVVRQLNRLSHKENHLMSIGQDILDAVTAETSVIDSFVTLVEGLIADNTIPAETGTAILKAIADEKAKVEAAIVANTPPTP